ncbi:ribose-5-phosphate isomerase [soil metagenome]
MRVHLGSDHAGLELKAAVAERLAADGHEVVDHGPATYDPDDDYPTFCLRAAEAVAAEPDSFGVVIGGSGNGEQIAANKVAGVRAALAWTVETAQLARQHNNAQVISVGARMHSIEEALSFVTAFVSQAFTGGPRHARRIEMLADYERSGTLPPLPS